MQRRDFLRVVGAASLAPAGLDASGGATDASPAATVLYNDRAIVLDRAAPDSKGAAEVL